MNTIPETDYGVARRAFCICASSAMIFALTVGLASAQDVSQNVNVTGSPAPGSDWQLYRQENEVSCASNPLNALNIICAFNWYGYADLPDKQGDAWIAWSSSNDGKNFQHQPLTGTKENEYLGFEFAADPTVMTFPGGAIITSIVGDRNGNSKMVAQRLVDMNRETGFSHAQEIRQQEIAFISGSNFIDKPDGEIIIMPGGGFRRVQITIDEIEDDPESEDFGENKVVTRLWPEFTVCVSFAVFNNSNQNVRTMASCSDDFGAEGTWSNPRQITQNNEGGLDQGLAMAAMGGTVLYVTRRFNSGDSDALIGSLARDRGFRPGKTFEIGNVCAFDQQTAPNSGNPDRASARSNMYPWVSATDTHFVLAYVDRPRDADGNCLPSYEGVGGGTRVMIRTSTNGTKWSDPVPVSPFEGMPVHFHFQPNVACARGACNVVFYSTLTESLAFEEVLSDTDKLWETSDFVEDLNVTDSKTKQLLRYRRSVDVSSSKITILDDTPEGTPVPSTPQLISRYQVDYDETGEPFQKDWNPLSPLIYGGMTLPFHGDYLANSAQTWRRNLLTGEWESNASPIGPVSDAINRVRYFAAWTDNRRIRGQIYEDQAFNDDGMKPQELPYEEIDNTGLNSALEDQPTSPTSDDPTVLAAGKTSEPVVESSSESVLPASMRPGGPIDGDPATVGDRRPDRFASVHKLRSEGVADPNPEPDTCQPTVPNPLGFYQTMNKNSEIYGATIEDRVRLVSPTLAKPTNRIQRGFVLGSENTSPNEIRNLLLVIANQPGKTPIDPDSVPITNVPDSIPDAEVFPIVRASWRQLPFLEAGKSEFDPDVDPPPDIDEVVEVQPLSTEYLTLFVVAQTNDAPVTIYAYDYDPTTKTRGELLSQLTVNGSDEAGELIDPGTTPDSVLLKEIHDPNVTEPVWSDLVVEVLNPNLKSPNLKSPNLKSPNLKSPNWKSTAYYNPNLKSDPKQNPNLKSETEEATNLQNPNLKSPNLKSGTIEDAFVDATFTVTSSNNTTTAINVDFAYAGNEIDAENVQVIAWNADDLTTAQDCEDGFITEPKVISAKSNPNLKSLAPADINDPFQGFVSFTLAPASLTQVTVRIFCQRAVCENLIKKDSGERSKLEGLLGYNFWAQKANTGKKVINELNEQVIKDVIPPDFQKEDGYVFRAEATTRGFAEGVDITDGTGTVANDKLVALDNGEPAEVNCTVALSPDPSTDPSMPPAQDIPLGITGISCVSQDDNTVPDPNGNPIPAPNIGTWSGTIRVEDNTLPVLTIPAASLTREPTSPSGAMVDYFALDAFGTGTGQIVATDDIDPQPITVNCTPGTDYVFPINDIGDEGTLVTCTASDHGPNSDGGVNTATGEFRVKIIDNTPPSITAPVAATFEATFEATASPETLLTCADLGTATGTDTSGDPTFTCDAPVDPEGFPLGDTVVTWTATDFSGNSATATQVVTIVDTTDPEVSVTVSDGNTQMANSLSGKAVDFTVNATDLFLVPDSVSCVETGTTTAVTSGQVFPVGTTSVTCSATDTSGNTGEAEFEVIIEFEYGIVRMSTTKKNPKTGTSIPITWALTENGVNQDVGSGNQSVNVFEGACGANGSLLAEDPGSSGIQLLPGNIYQYNWQAVYPAGHPKAGQDLPAPAPYCIQVRVSTTEQELELTIDLKP